MDVNLTGFFWGWKYNLTGQIVTSIWDQITVSVAAQLIATAVSSAIAAGAAILSAYLINRGYRTLETQKKSI
jgi:putative flippase GtrA